MASSLPGLEEDLTCPMCCSIFQHPVLLSCSHGFCHACLKKWWTQRRTKDCPVCYKISSKERPHTNLIVKNMCDKVLEEKRQKALNSELLTVFSLRHTAHREKLTAHSEKLTAHGEKHTAHGEKLRHSEEEKRKNERLIDEVRHQCKQQLQESLKALKKKQRIFDDVKANYNQRRNHIKVHVRDMERQIKEQFKRLHEFLHKEEEARIAALREEEEWKSQKTKERIEWLSREMAALSDAIRATEDHLQSYNHVSFLENYKATVDRVQLPLKVPQPVSGELIDEAKHLANLTFTVWDEMGDCILYSCDPGSQHSHQLQLQFKLYFNVTDLPVLERPFPIHEDDENDDETLSIYRQTVCR